MKTWFVTLAILIVAWGSVWADVPPPPNATKAEIEAWQRGREANQRARFGIPPAPVLVPQSKTKELPFVVIGNGGPGELRLVLPAKLIKELQTAQTSNGGFRLQGPEQIPTLIAGLALSLAVVTGGLWLLRSRRRLAFGTVAFVLATTTVLGIGCIHTKNKTTEDQKIPNDSLVQTPDGKLIGQAVLESSDKEAVQVFVEREAMGRFIASSGMKTEIMPVVISPSPAGASK